VLIHHRPCKAKKVKCGEEKPNCLNCERQGEACDYSIRLNWAGRTKKKADSGTPEPACSIRASRALCLPGTNSFTINFAGPTVQESPWKLESTEVKKQSNAISSQSEDKGRNNERPPKQHTHPSAITTQRPSIPTFRNHQPSTTAASATEITVIDPVLARVSKQPISNSDSPRTLEDSELGRNLADNRRPASSYTTRGGSSAVSPPRLKDLGDSSIYPSPTVSNHESPGLNDRPTSNHNLTPQQASNAIMLPPYHVPLSNFHIVSREDRDHTSFPDNSAKRIKLSPAFGSVDPAQTSDIHAYDTSSAYNGYDARTKFAAPVPPYNPYNSIIGTPLTPTSPSAAPEDAHQHLDAGASPHAHRDSLDLRRLSVNSILSGPPEGDGSRTATHAEQLCTISSYPFRDLGTETVTYGLDRGFPDLDVSKNNDMNAINGMSPAMVNDDMEVMVQNLFGDGYYVPTEFGFGLQAKDTAFGKGGFYAKPVPVKIPRSLEPLPPTLLQNPMNLLYFHHFLNHTARMLVPHDCSENPFRKILPQSIAA